MISVGLELRRDPSDDSRMIDDRDQRGAAGELRLSNQERDAWVLLTPGEWNRDCVELAVELVTHRISYQGEGAFVAQRTLERFARDVSMIQSTGRGLAVLEAVKASDLRLSIEATTPMPLVRIEASTQARTGDGYVTHSAQTGFVVDLSQLNALSRGLFSLIPTD